MLDIQLETQTYIFLETCKLVEKKGLESVEINSPSTKWPNNSKRNERTGITLHNLDSKLLAKKKAKYSSTYVKIDLKLDSEKDL